VIDVATSTEQPKVGVPDSADPFTSGTMSIVSVA
jgi:hypothetical protein